jgi:hypothetical protein
LQWEDLTWLRSLTTLPILLKGIQHPDDVRRAKDYGVDGRQWGFSSGTLPVLRSRGRHPRVHVSRVITTPR